MDIILYKIWTKANEGSPWTFRSVSTKDNDLIVKPYNVLVEKQPGYFESRFSYTPDSKSFMRGFVMDTVENAKNLYKLLTDETVPEVKALTDMTYRYGAKLGTSYAITWKLTQLVER